MLCEVILRRKINENIQYMFTCDFTLVQYTNILTSEFRLLNSPATHVTGNSGVSNRLFFQSRKALP